MVCLRLVLLWLVVALPFPSRAQNEDAAFLAQKRFEAARQLYDAGDFAGALSGFSSSFALLASPNTGLYIARSLGHLGRLGEAVARYEDVIRRSREHPEAQRYAQAARAARQESAQLEPRIARLTVTLRGAPPGTRVLLDGRTLPEAPRRAPLDTGPAELVVDPPGLATVHRALTLLAGKHLQLEIALEPPGPASQPLPPPPRPTGGRLRRGLQIGGWTAAAAGTASLIASIVCWRLAQDRFDQLEDRCGDGNCPEELRATRDEGRSYELATNVTLGVGIGLAVTGGAMLLGSLLADRPRLALGGSASGLVLAWELD